MKTSLKWPVLAVLLCAPLTAEAHRVWMLPSATVLSGDDDWITVDAAVSNDLFYFEHFHFRSPTSAVPRPLLGRPRTGRPVVGHGAGWFGDPHQNGSIGRYRSTFDVQLTQKGTYKIAVLNGGLRQLQRGRPDQAVDAGRPRDYAAAIPADVEELRVNLYADPDGDFRHLRQADDRYSQGDRQWA